VTRTQKIQHYIEDRFLFEFGGDITAETDLFKVGVIDSFGYITLMSFLEKEFSLDITAEEILGNVLVSLVTIDEFVARKLAANGAR
jgi:D-alanine--poly(phosphoribitol) ligase subunit 2